MANVNTKTGISYGVVNGNAVPYLLDEIFSSGESLTYAAARADLIEKIRGALEQIADDSGAFGDRIKRIADACDPEEIAQAMLDAGLADHWEFDEEEHEYSESTEFGEVHYLQSYLGGAPLIWITESPYVAYARGCSPCVPGAGDLDNLMDADNGDLCYCCPPDCFRNDNDDDDGEQFGVVGTTKINGRTYQIVGKLGCCDDCDDGELQPASSLVKLPDGETICQPCVEFRKSYDCESVRNVEQIYPRFDVFRSANRAGGTMQHAGQVSARNAEHALEIAQNSIECDKTHSLSVSPVE